MTKLNDIQLILLTNAAQHEDGNLLPVTASIADAGARLTKAITSLTTRGLVEERPSTDAATVYRTDGDLRFGIYITDAGREAVDGGTPKGQANEDCVETTPAPAPAKPERKTKSAAVIALLKRGEGATLAELIEATGWLPHTTRAALTGLKKKGHVIEKSKRGDATCYRIVQG